MSRLNFISQETHNGKSFCCGKCLVGSMIISGSMFNFLHQWNVCWSMLTYCEHLAYFTQQLIQNLLTGISSSPLCTVNSQIQKFTTDFKSNDEHLIVLQLNWPFPHHYSLPWVSYYFTSKKYGFRVFLKSWVPFVVFLELNVMKT